jgi:heme/copper-type cytochrome/quinol oxidase subunit 3
MQKRELNVAGYPSVVFGYRSLIWWGTMGMMLIEGTMFAITLAAYFFLRTRSSDWPPGLMPPRITAGTVNLAIFLVSVAPAIWVQKVAEKGDLGKTQIGLVVMSLVGIGNLIARVYEFPSLMSTWDANAYASITWMLLGLHTVHLATDWADTVVLTVLMFTDRVDGKRFMDTSENSDYWYFVVLTWIPIYLVIYWAPRWL